MLFNEWNHLLLSIVTECFYASIQSQWMNQTGTINEFHISLSKFDVESVPNMTPDLISGHFLDCHVLIRMVGHQYSQLQTSCQHCLTWLAVRCRAALVSACHLLCYQNVCFFVFYVKPCFFVVFLEGIALAETVAYVIEDDKWCPFLHQWSSRIVQN